MLTQGGSIALPDLVQADLVQADLVRADLVRATRPASRERGSLHAALGIVFVLAAGVSAIEWGWLHDARLPYGWLLEAYGLIGLFSAAVGLWLWARRPTNRTGLLLVVVGVCIIGSAAGNLPNRWMLMIGLLFGSMPIPALNHLVLAFPSGALRDRLSKGLVVVLYALTASIQAAVYAIGPDSLAIPRLHVAGHDDLLPLFHKAITWSGLIFIPVAAVLLRRWRTTSILSERRALGLVHTYGLAALVSFPLSATVLGPVLHWSVFTLFGVQLLVLIGVPVVFATAIGSGALSATISTGELAGWLSADPGRRPPLRHALAIALGDPSVELLHEIPGLGQYVDGAGRLAQLPAAGERRRSVTLAGELGSAAIVYDGELIGNADTVVNVGRVAALAIERERLASQLAASRSELSASRQLMIRQAERAEQDRRLLAQNLHDGVQGRLVMAAARADQLGTTYRDTARHAEELRDELDGVISELRGLLHDIVPPLLYERDLYDALDDLVDRLPLPARLDVGQARPSLPTPVASAAYFIAAEALANVIKHARASRVRVAVEVSAGILRLEVRDDGIGAAGARRGALGLGLTGMAERAAALGGRVDVVSPPGEGTTIRAELPCG